MNKPKGDGFLGRLAKGAIRLGHSAGLIKQNPNFLAQRLDQFSQVFTGTDPWLSPGVPLEPKSLPGTPPRQFQFPPGYNIQISPRSTEAVSFAQLRGLSEYTLTRILIERVKENIKGHEWDIVAEDKSGATNYEQDILMAKEFFEKPDKRRSWDEWIGELLEEVLVIDAPAIFVHKNRMGQLWALEIINGATIKVLADERGFEPMPPLPAYQQFLYGVPYVNLTRDELIYRPRNRRVDHFYGFSPVEQTLITINQGIRREMHTLAQFTDGNIPAAFLRMPKDWSAEEIKQFQEYWDAVLSGDPQNRSKLRFIPGGEGTGVDRFHDEEVFGLFNKFDEWLARVLCYSFGLSPISFVTMTNRSVAQEMGDGEAENGIASVKLFIERLINEILDHVMMVPHLQFNWVTDRSRIQARHVDRNEKYAKIGVFQIDEIRAEEGLPPLGLPPGMITASGYVPFAQPASVPSVASPTMVNGLPIGTNPEHGHQPPAASPGVPQPPEAAAPQAQDRKFDQRTGDPLKRFDTQSGEDLRRFDTRTGAALRRCTEDELGKWERFALSRLEKGKQAAEFKTEFLDEEEAAGITGELAKAKLPDEVRHIFATRRRSVPVLRLQPPRAAEASHQSNDVKLALRSLLEREAQLAIDGRAKKDASAETPIQKREERPDMAAYIPQIRMEPIINVTVPKPDPVTVNVTVPEIKIPETKVTINVPKPDPVKVDVHVPKQDAPQVTVNLPEPKAKTKEITIELPGGKKVKGEIEEKG